MHHSIGMALYHTGLLTTYLRPAALLNLRADEVIPRDSTDPASQVVLVVAPFERGVATKSGYYDETVLMDGSVCPVLGDLYIERAATRRRASLDSRYDRATADSVCLWDFTAKALNNAWQEAVASMQLESMDTVYQARHGGASRDLMAKARSAEEVILRGFWANLNAMRTYHKPGRIQQLVAKAHPDVLSYALDIKVNFAKYVRAGDFPRAPLVAPMRRRRAVD